MEKFLLTTLFFARKNRLLGALLFCFLTSPPLVIALTPTETHELKKLVHWLPTFSCQDHKTLKSCIMWTNELCEEQVEKSMNSCFELHKSRISQLGPSLDDWKEKIITCTEVDVIGLTKTTHRDNTFCKNRGVLGLKSKDSPIKRAPPRRILIKVIDNEDDE